MPSQPKDKPKGKTGPKTSWRMTPETIEKLRQAFAIDATIAEACFYADINPDTYYRWKKREPQLSEKLELLRNTPILAARQTIATGIKSDPALALKYLERKRKDEFSLKTEQDVSIKEVPQALVEIVDGDKPSAKRRQD